MQQSEVRDEPNKLDDADRTGIDGCRRIIGCSSIAWYNRAWQRGGRGDVWVSCLGDVWGNASCGVEFGSFINLNRTFVTFNIPEPELLARSSSRDLAPQC